jgi:type I restriction enzyme S subunit
MTKLFNENLGTASNRRRLDQLKKKFSHYDSTYVAVATISTRHDFRDWLESLWIQYKPYADTNFEDELKKHFAQRAWELHLGTTLLNRGYALAEHKNTGPDFAIPYEDKNIQIEAIAVEKGNGQDKVPEMEFIEKMGEMDVPEKEMLLRLTSGLEEKYRKYLSYLKNSHIKNEDPFVIAIDRSDLGHVDPQIPLVLKCLFAIGHQVLFIKKDNASSPKITGSTWSGRDKLNKASGSEIPLLFFRDSTYEGLSAVIYCTDNILNSPKDPKRMGDNFVIVHNPFAKNPLPDNYLKFGDIWKQEGNQVKKI